VLRITLDDTQRAALRQFARHAVGRLSERAHFVLLADQGLAPSEIARLMGYTVNTVKLWLERYAQGHLAGLQDEPRSGRPMREPHLTDIVEAQASQTPPSYGYVQAIWTVGLLVLHLTHRFNVHASASSVWRALRALRFSWHRPKLAPAHRPDPEREAKEARLQAVLADPHATVLATDECEVCLLAGVRAMWQRVKTQRRLPTPGQNAKRAVFGALDLRRGGWHYRVSPHKRSADFTAFLEALLSAYAVGMVYVILDNVSIHHSRITLTWLSAHPRLQLVYLPTYTGHRLNPVEKVWWQLKRTIAANRNFTDLTQLEGAVDGCLRAFGPAALLRLTNCEVTRQAQRALMAPSGTSDD
jgi:transposase